MEQTIEQFKSKILKRDKPRKHTIKNSFGLKDCYDSIKDKTDINYKIFSSIIKDINKGIIRKLVEEGKTIYFPYVGKVFLIKKDVPKIINGKLNQGLCIDWNKTLEWWYEDPEARKNKSLIRQDYSKVLAVTFRKNSFKNNTFFKFSLCRTAKNILSNNIKECKIDAYELYKH